MIARTPENKKIVTELKLNFKPKVLLGRSYVRTGFPLNTPHTVTDKFHEEDKYAIPEAKIQERCEKLKIIGPKEKYGKHITENQRYGWNPFPLNDTDLSDKRLNFSMRTDEWIKLYLMTTVHKK